MKVARQAGSAATDHPSRGATAIREPFGVLADGRTIERVTLRNANGMQATVMTLGATLQSLRVADRDGTVADVVLGHDDAAPYAENPRYFGVTVGRYANRIAGARFAIDGAEHRLEANDGPNHLHGGHSGFEQQIWTITAIESGDEARLVLEHRSADGEGGYPGALIATATYTLNDDDELGIAYRATTSRPTMVNLTNHSFFNLAGGGTAMDHRLTIFAAHYLPVDDALIPTGAAMAVADTPFDFRRPCPVGARIRDGRDRQLTIGRGYDHHFIVDGAPGDLRRAARLEDPRSGRVMDVLVTAPGVQFYSGNFLDGSTAGRNGCLYRAGDGLCLEPQIHPDAPNQPHFPSARLDPGDVYDSRIVLRFSTMPNATGGFS